MGSRVEYPGRSSVGGDCARACSHACARNFAPERLLTSVFFTPTPFERYGELTGMPAMPPLFALAYHQCRWNYNDEEDVDQVSERLDEADFPVDVIWLDIEHTDGKRYFMWDTSKFPTPEVMQNKVALKGRKMVNIVDPHIKVAGGYRIHEDAKALGHFVKNKDGGDYEGWCWPGSSSWIDFMDPNIQNWWSDQFAYDKYVLRAAWNVQRAPCPAYRSICLDGPKYEPECKKKMRHVYTAIYSGVNTWWLTLFAHLFGAIVPAYRSHSIGTLEPLSTCSSGTT